MPPHSLKWLVTVTSNFRRRSMPLGNRKNGWAYPGSLNAYGSLLIDMRHLASISVIETGWHIRQQCISSFVQLMAWGMFCVKSLTVSMKTHCQLHLWNHISMISESQDVHFDLGKCTSKCLQNSCHLSTLRELQYISRNMHTVFALMRFVVVIHWLIFPYPSGLLHWHCGNLPIAPVPAKQPWWIWINTSLNSLWTFA